MRDAITPFRSHLPVRVSFGDGVIAELPDALAELGASSALVVVEEPVAGHPDVVAALAAVESGGVRLERFVKGPGEPTFLLADELAAQVAGDRLDAVVGIGGGSALDVAKAARIAADQRCAVEELASGGHVPTQPEIGLVLCPTTSGTGSEVSGASVLTNTERDRKVGFGHPNMRAQHALVDPVLTHGLPPGPTAHSGVDALAQAVGACTVRNSSPLSVAFGLEACHHITHSLRRAVENGADAAARRRLACTSLAAGLAMNLSDCAADHALGQALGSVEHLPHGLTVGSSSPRRSRSRAATAASGSSASRTRSASRRTGRPTARGRCGPCGGCSRTSASRRLRTSPCRRRAFPRSSRARPATRPTTSRSTATRGRRPRSSGPSGRRCRSRHVRGARAGRAPGTAAGIPRSR